MERVTYTRLQHDADAPTLSSQVANILRARIDNGTYPINEGLPSQAYLQAEFRVSATVIRRAHTRLSDLGMVKMGRGYAPRVLRRSTEPQGAGSVQSQLYVLAALDGVLDALARATDHIQALRRTYALTDRRDNGPSTEEE